MDLSERTRICSIAEDSKLLTLAKIEKMKLKNPMLGEIKGYEHEILYRGNEKFVFKDYSIPIEKKILHKPN